MILQAIVYELMEQRWRLRPDAGILFTLVMIGLWTCIRIWWPRHSDEAMPGWAQREDVQAEPEPEIGGVYAPPRPRKVLHSQVVEFKTEPEPRRWNEVG